MTCCSLTAAVHAGVILHSLHSTVCVVDGETLQATATTREEEAQASDEEATDGDSEGGIGRRRQSEEAAEVHRAHAEAVARESEGARRREEVAARQRREAAARAREAAREAEENLAREVGRQWGAPQPKAKHLFTSDL